jgi:hypothetical protein
VLRQRNHAAANDQTSRAELLTRLLAEIGDPPSGSVLVWFDTAGDDLWSGAGYRDRAVPTHVGVGVINDVWMQLCFTANDLLAWAQAHEGSELVMEHFREGDRHEGRMHNHENEQ